MLSPLLWTILMDELLTRLIEEGFSCLGYADDLVIIVRGKFATPTVEPIEVALNITNDWCKRKELGINPGKLN